MEITDKERLPYPAALVWKMVVVPENFRAWNDKITRIAARGEFRAGQSFVTSYRLNGPETQFLTEVAELEETRLLVLRHKAQLSSGPAPLAPLEAVERIELSESGGATLLTKTVTVRNHGVPWYFVPVIWFITRFGKPVGPSKLAALCAEAARRA